MSKKKAKKPTKGKVVAQKAPKKVVKKVAKKAVKRTASSALAVSTLAVSPSKRTKTATIFIFNTGGGTKIRTSPQRLYCNPGDAVEFNIVNMVDDSDAPVTIVFPEGGPWGKEPFQVRNFDRKPTGDVPPGRFKYTITAMGAEEDPEVEMPESN